MSGGGATPARVQTVAAKQRKRARMPLRAARRTIVRHAAAGPACAALTAGVSKPPAAPVLPVAAGGVETERPGPRSK